MQLSPATALPFGGCCPTQAFLINRTSCTRWCWTTLSAATRCWTWWRRWRCCIGRVCSCCSTRATAARQAPHKLPQQRCTSSTAWSAPCSSCHCCAPAAPRPRWCCSTAATAQACSRKLHFPAWWWFRRVAKTRRYFRGSLVKFWSLSSEVSVRGTASTRSVPAAQPVRLA